MVPVKQEPRVYYQLNSDLFKIASPIDSSQISLVNLHPIVIRPFVATIIPLGLKVVHCSSQQAFILVGYSEKKVFCHTGLIDPGYRGEVKMVVLSKTQYNITLFAGELKVFLFTLYFSTPVIQDISILNRPQYSLDAGYDLHLPENITLYPQSCATITLNHQIPTPSNSFKPVIFGRSGLATEGVVMLVTKWTHSPLTLKLYNYTDQTLMYPSGTRICQVVFVHKMHFPTKLKAFFLNVKSHPKTPFFRANVYFVNIQNETLPPSAKISALDKFQVDKQRGNCGFGSSGK
nr:dUTPase [Macronycteris gammaherpesvirus 1]